MSQQTQDSPADNISNRVSGFALSDVSLELGDGAQKVRVLDYVNLHVEDGEFVAIVGPSGSGKSSLLAVAGALSLPDTGSVRLRGQELTTLTAKQRAKHRLQ